MRHILACLVLALLIPGCNKDIVEAVPYSVKGQVTNSATGEPVVGATIWIDNQMAGTTDSEGRYQKAVSHTLHPVEIRFEAPGFVGATFSFPSDAEPESGSRVYHLDVELRRFTRAPATP